MLLVPNSPEDPQMNLTYSSKLSACLLHDEELHTLYSSPNKIRIIKSRSMRWAGHVASMGRKRNVWKIFVGNPEGKRPLVRPRLT
jgi:hypothetical protein